MIVTAGAGCDLETAEEKSHAGFRFKKYTEGAGHIQDFGWWGGLRSAIDRLIDRHPE